MRELAPEKVVRKRSDKRNACIGTPVKRKWLVTAAASKSWGRILYVQQRHPSVYKKSRRIANKTDLDVLSGW